MARSIKRQSKLWMDSRAGALRRLPDCNVFSRIEFKCNVRTILLEHANKSRVFRVRHAVKSSAIRAKKNFLRDRQKNGESNKVSIMLFATQS